MLAKNAEEIKNILLEKLGNSLKFNDRKTELQFFDESKGVIKGVYKNLAFTLKFDSVINSVNFSFISNNSTTLAGVESLAQNLANIISKDIMGKPFLLVYQPNQAVNLHTTKTVKWAGSDRAIYDSVNDLALKLANNELDSWVYNEKVGNEAANKIFSKPVVNLLEQLAEVVTCRSNYEIDKINFLKNIRERNSESKSSSVVDGSEPIVSIQASDNGKYLHNFEFIHDFNSKETKLSFPFLDMGEVSNSYRYHPFEGYRRWTLLIFNDLVSKILDIKDTKSFLYHNKKTTAREADVAVWLGKDDITAQKKLEELIKNDDVYLTVNPGRKFSEIEPIRTY